MTEPAGVNLHAPEATLATAARIRSRRATATAAVATIACVMPMFLTGALAVQIIDELSMTRATLGLAVGVYIATQSVLSPVFGRVVDRIGAVRSLRAAAVVAASCCAGVAAFVHSGTGLLVALVVGGAASSVAQPAASAMISRGVRRERQGIAFGIFQSAKPAGALLGGLAVPVIALTVGWRWAFVVAAVAALVVAMTVAGREQPRAPSSGAVDAGRIPRKPLVFLMISTALAFGSASMFVTFLVDSGVHAGLGPGAAGLLLSVASGVAIGARLVAGVFADRRGHGHLLIVCGMMVVGAAGLVLLAADLPLFLLGAFLGGAMGWGYNGLYYLAVTQLQPDAPGAITGLMLSGGSIGGCLAPVIFGMVVERSSYTVAWTMGAVWLLSGAALLWWSRRLILAERVARG